ncbi:MAG: GerMN domain-containing protein [Treponema sp.]|jgi:cytoskeletal protein RodZ|nr:GerMN domain-containing protein [Treponema sp.]
MAVRRTGVQKTRNSGKKPSKNDNRVPVSMIFWVLFFIVLITAFFVLLPKVKKGVNTSPKYITTEQPAPEKPSVFEQSVQPEKPPAKQSSEKSSVNKPPVNKPTVDKPPAAPAKEKPKEKTPPKKPPVDKPAVDKSTGQQTPSPPKAQQPAAQPSEKPAETRDRSIYFMQDGGADLLLVKANRKLKVSDSPLIDCLNALLAGPTAEEKNRGLVSFVPPGTRLISAQVRQNTVYLNFNEEFRYNTLGREGCAAQLKQIVWTATEFSTVHNVQIQIEGKTVDFLVEGIMIRNPIGR